MATRRTPRPPMPGIPVTALDRIAMAPLILRPEPPDTPAPLTRAQPVKAHRVLREPTATPRTLMSLPMHPRAVTDLAAAANKLTRPTVLRECNPIGELLR